MHILTNELANELFGEIETKEIEGGWVEITNDFEEKHMVSVPVPFLFGKKYINRRILPALFQCLHMIERNAAIYGGSYEYIQEMQFFAPRHIARNPERPLSLHTWGIAFDINPWENMPGASSYAIPEGIVNIFKKLGFNWGGDFKHPDPMHFEPRSDFMRYRGLWG